ncbi:trypsin-like serine protease [Cystobacter fuscus]
MKRFIRHPDYQPATAQNDIALLELEQSVDARSVLAPLPRELCRESP